MSISAEIQNFLSNKFTDHSGEFKVSEPETRTYNRHGKKEQIETIKVQTPYVSKAGEKNDKTKVVASALYNNYGRGNSRFPRRLFHVSFAN